MGSRMSQPTAAGKLTELWSSRRAWRSSSVATLAVFAALVGFFVLSAAPASAASKAPFFSVVTAGVPSVLPPGVGRRGKYDVSVENVGAANSEGTVVVKDVLPAGLTIITARPEPEEGLGPECVVGGSGGEVSCTYPEAIVPAGFVVLNIEYVVTGAVGSLVNHVSVSGGNAPPVAAENSTRLGAEHEKGPGGIAEFGFKVTGPGGEPVTQAGAHPNFLTTSVLFNNMLVEGVNEPAKPVEAVKDLAFYLPLGMLGNPSVTDTCPASIVETKPGQTGCPPGSRVGTILAMLLSGVFANTPDATHEHGIYSVTPEKGYAAEFAFTSNNYTFFIYASVVRHDGAYMLRVATPGVPQISYLIGLVATFYGSIQENYVNGTEEFTFNRGSFLTNPTDCQEGPQARETSVAMNTWEHPTSTSDAVHPFFESVSAFSALEGCELLAFSSSLGVTPQTAAADTPSGYELVLGVPQAPNGPVGLGTPPVRDVSVTFPAGTTISPSSANGLQACQETGSSGINIEGGESEEEAPDGLLRPAAGHCPFASQIATVSATTPLLAGEEQLKGHIFLATPKCGGSGQPGCSSEDAVNGNLFGLYLELRDPQTGIVIKLPGHASVDPGTGQITASFDDNPQFPFSDLVVSTNTGPRAPLANPQTCGTATTNGTVVPWSTPATVSAQTSSSFEVQGCSGVFAPGFSAGTVSSQAGGYSPFTLTLKREDREQNISSIATTLPQGLLASVANVAQCPEPQASAGGCPSSSQVGMTTVGVGSGSEPYYVTGQVYFTGPYNGAPFGLSVVVPAVAGPFNLGNVIVRVGLHIDPHTAQVTATSSPFPQIIDGVPLRIRTVNVTLNDPVFTFNPTSCAPLSITGTVASTQGATVGISSPFQAVGCKNLPFKPILSASTKGTTSKANGASLTIKVGSGTGQANISKVRLVFPKQLPARLTTLQKACTETQFNADPAGCPAGSVIGTATARTPVLAHALTGPIYLVSHGGAAFPDAIVILQGEGVLLYLDGNTNIKKGITTSTFNSIPDAPISIFEATLPQGAHSAFATDIPTKAKGSLCGQSLTLPATITGQNGAQISQNTKIGVTGCAKTKTLTRPQKFTAALKACKKKAQGGSRVSCEKQARKKYGPVQKKK